MSRRILLVSSRLLAERLAVPVLSALLLAGCKSAPPLNSAADQPSPSTARRTYQLDDDAYWHLELPGGKPFDASGLLLHNGSLLVVNDRIPGLYRIHLHGDHSATVNSTEWFNLPAPLRLSPDKSYDCEAIASDRSGNLYLAEESQRAIYLQHPGDNAAQRLTIDWSPVTRFFNGGSNASFEGLAVGKGKIWIANERSDPRIIVVDLQTLSVEGSFFVDASGFAFGGPHYSGLSWFDNHLYVLDRNHRAILKVDPGSKKVLAEYNFGRMELQEHLAYKSDYPTGAMEGIAVDANFFWLVTDNNGKGRYQAPNDTRPTLFRCKRPDAVLD